MSKKSNISTALWFIPLLAVPLAVLFLFVFWVGRIVLHKSTGSSSKKPIAQENVDAPAHMADVLAPIIPPATPEIEEEIPVPQEIIDMNEELEQTEQAEQAAPEVCPATTMAVKNRNVKFLIPLIKRAYFNVRKIKFSPVPGRIKQPRTLSNIG